MKSKYLILLLFAMAAIIPLTGQKPAKKVILSGSVVDADRKPVKDAIILIDDEMTRTVTDAKGFYRLKIKPDAKTVAVFTFGGINEESINGRSVIDFILQATGQTTGNNNNDKINIGYGSGEKKDLSVPVHQIDGKKAKYASYSDIYELIGSEVPGVQVIRKEIFIQGVTSTNKTPILFVVNGVIIDSIDDIRPQEVSSIEILKGAAASIYGSRGANGVILINLTGAATK
jgi:TonB-dependent SusC/RagA subfamily outer membrane receptor